MSAFLVTDCEGHFLISSGEVLNFVKGILERSVQHSLYAIYSVPKREVTDLQGDYIVATTPGQQASPAAFGNFWVVSRAGKLVAVDTGCLQPMAMRVTFWGLAGERVLGPFVRCSLSTGNLSLELTVEAVDYARDRAMIVGSATGAGITGEPAVVRLGTSANWGGDVRSIEEVRGGMKFMVNGVLGDDCTIDAEAIERIS